MKNHKEIAEEIKWLRDNKTKVRQYSHFGDDNHASIDAELAVLEDNLDDGEIYNKQDDGDWSENQVDNALHARRWLDGEEAESPSFGWKPLCK